MPCEENREVRPTGKRRGPATVSGDEPRATAAYAVGRRGKKEPGARRPAYRCLVAFAKGGTNCEDDGKVLGIMELLCRGLLFFALEK